MLRVCQKTYLNYLLPLFLFGMILPSYAQEGLQKDKAYFYENLVVYQDWLDSTQLSNYFKIKNLAVHPTQLVLSMELAKKEDWFDVKDEFQRQFKTDAGKKMLDKFAFQMAVGGDSIEIQIACQQEKYPIELKYIDNEFTVLEALPFVSTRGSFKIELSDIPVKDPQRTKGSAKDVKDLIILYLQDYYGKKKFLWRKAKFEVIDNEDEVNFEISNIKKEVLDDFLIGYFEYIKIDFYIEQKGQIVEVNYDLQAKYGSGILVAPRRSGYKDMEPKYQDYIDQYRKKFKSMIKAVMNAKALKG